MLTRASHIHTHIHIHNFYVRQKPQKAQNILRKSIFMRKGKKNVYEILLTICGTPWNRNGLVSLILDARSKPIRCCAAKLPIFNLLTRDTQRECDKKNMRTQANNNNNGSSKSNSKKNAQHTFIPHRWCGNRIRF